ncbi:DMT family transporter [Candidatus Nomurabacteria bacterium]|nr:DMT family transporter [Candidatus Nomurabacteria bacterium]
MILLSYIVYFIFASASPLQRRWLAVTKDAEPSGQVLFSFQVMLFLVAGSLFLPFFSELYFSGGTLKLTLLSLTCGFFGACYFVSNYVAQKHIDASVTNIVVNIYTPVTIVLASFFLNEGLTIIQILGTVLLLFALVIVSKKHRIGRFKFDKYFLLMLLSGVFLGILLVAERALQKTTGFTGGVMLSWWSQCFFLGVATLITNSRHMYSKQDIAITGVLRFLQALSYIILLYLVGNLSVVSSITTFKVVIIFIAAAIFLNEREDLPRKIFGCVVALVGLLLMK